MNKSKISLQSLEKALTSLERALAQPKNEFNRDSVIQRFEFSFELCWKSALRIIQADHPLTDSSVRGVLREASRLGWIQTLDAWFRFQEARNLSSHTYNEETAEEVYLEAAKFASEGRKLFEILQLELLK